MLTSIYGSLNAKVKAMRGRLLRYDDYYNLSQQRTVEDVVSNLREHPAYEPFLYEIEGKNLRRGKIEQKILFSLADDFSRIYNFIYDFGLKSFFDGFFLRNEIMILKHLLLSIYDNRDVSYTIPELHTLISSNLKIDLSRLVESKTVRDFIENLKGTIFYGILSTGYDENTNLFNLEMKLDVYYYIHLWKFQNKYLDKSNRTAMMRINGTEIDLRNILWIYRLKYYYKLNVSEIYSYLIPINYKLRNRQLIRMVEAKSVEELWGEIKSCPYANAFDEDKTIESCYYSAMNSAYFRSQIQNPNSLALAIGYIHLKEIEIKNITSLLEGVRYSLKQEEILRYIILPQEKR